MIVVNAVIETTAEDLDAMREAIASMEIASRAEPGCDDYTFSVEINDATRVRITERWVDEDALRGHFQTPHMASFNAAMGARPPKDISVHCYEVKEIPLPRP